MGWLHRLAAAHQHAHGAAAVPAARHRRGARVARAAANRTRTASRSTSPTIPTSRRCSTTCSSSTSTRRRGSPRSTSSCSSRSSAASSRARTPLRRRSGPVRRARPCAARPARCLPGTTERLPECGADATAIASAAIDRCGRPARAAVPGRAVRRRAASVLGLGRARLPARDREPRVPHRPGRCAGRGGTRRRLRVHRPAGRSSRAQRSSNTLADYDSSRTAAGSSPRRRCRLLDDARRVRRRATRRGTRAAGQAGDFTASHRGTSRGRGRARAP